MTNTEKPELWQPIETAPKDGTRVLAWDGWSVQTLEYWDGNEEWGQVGDSDRLTVSYPTHWMPLPSPPKDGGE
jgi:hypothetical protein